MNSTDKSGSSSLVNCMRSCDIELCKLYVERGADPKVKLKTGATSLHDAPNSAAARYLVNDCGLYIDACYTDELPRLRSPFSFAAAGGKEDVCKLLLELGANVDKGHQPLLVAAEVCLIFSLSFLYKNRTAATGPRSRFSFTGQ